MLNVIILKKKEDLDPRKLPEVPSISLSSIENNQSESPSTTATSESSHSDS